MKTELILKSDVLDIIFDNRNKSYGAYTLRKFYNNRMYKALGATLLIVLVLCSFTFIKNDYVVEPVYIVHDGPTFVDLKEKEKTPEKPKEIPQKANEATVKSSQPSQVFVIPKITTRKIDVPEVRDLVDNIAISTSDIKGDPKSIFIPGEVPSGGNDSGFVQPKKPEIDKFSPFETADVNPQYPGGMAAFRKFLEKNLTNPQDIEEGEKVAVKIKFIVGYDGQLKGFEIMEDGGKAFNNEVIRVLKKMPTWIPGKMKGESVSVYYTIPVMFLSRNEN